MSPRFDDGNVWFGWVDYDGTTLEVRANQTGIRPQTPNLSRNVNVAGLLGQSSAYVGFTAATGDAWENVDVLSFAYRDTYNPITILSQIPDATVPEQLQWQYTPPVIGNGFTFGLSNSPTGMSVNTNSGTLSWTPTERQGPSTNANISYSVYSAGLLVASTNFNITVNEVNVPPVLHVPNQQTLYATTTLTVTNYATDSDWPSNSLTFGLAAGTPSGVSINPTTGVITWVPTVGQVGTNSIRVKVTDYNPWAVNSQQLSTTNSFTVVVNEFSTPPNFTQQPASQVITSGTGANFCAAATGTPAPTYQWRFNGVNIPGATGLCYALPSTSVTNIGTYDVVVANLAGTNSSTAATLAFSDLKMLAAVYLTGPIGKSYQIEATPSFSPTNWTVLTNVTITTQPFIYVDYASETNRMQFYRSVPLP